VELHLARGFRVLDRLVSWPPKPGELWIADIDWPAYGFIRTLDTEILQGDVFLVVEAGEINLTTAQENSDAQESVLLNVIIRGKQRLMMTERRAGKPDIHPV